MNNSLENVKTINRATIADGKLLQAFVAEPLHKNDELLLQNINEIYEPLTSVYTTVKDNSATNWDNSKVSGFSAFNFNTTAEIGSAPISKTLELESSDKIKVIGGQKKITISASPDYARSYYARAMKMGSYVDDTSVAFNGSSATNHGFAYSVYSSATDHGVIFARGKSFASDYGVVYSLHNTMNTGYASHSSIAIYDSSMSGKSNIGLYGSTSDDLSCSSLLSYFSTAENAQCGIAKYGSLIKNANDVAMYNATAISESIAFYDASAKQKSIAFYNSTADSQSISIYDSFANTKSIAFDNSVAETSSVAMYGSYASNCSIAYGEGSSATNHSIAISSVDVENYSIGFKSTIGYSTISSISIFNTSTFTSKFDEDEKTPLALEKSIAMYNGNASWESVAASESIAEISSMAFNKSRAYSQSIAATMSYATFSSIAIDASTAQYKGVAFSNSSAYDYSFACYESKADDHSIAKYGSRASISSVAFGFASATNKSIAMYESTATDCSIALFNSTAANSALSLYNNKINIKHDGSLNGLLLTKVNGTLYVN